MINNYMCRVHVEKIIVYSYSTKFFLRRKLINPNSAISKLQKAVSSLKFVTGIIRATLCLVGQRKKQLSKDPFTSQHITFVLMSGNSYNPGVQTLQFCFLKIFINLFVQHHHCRHHHHQCHHRVLFLQTSVKKTHDG